MAYVVTEACIGVKGEGCMEVCPEACIFSAPEDFMSYIDPVRCTHCGACMAACVVGAIFPDTGLAEENAEFALINAGWFRRPAGVRARVRELAVERAIWLPPEA
ncbi:MAG: 4Fe-4S binding protein [Pseudomonadales bacterium]|nr:4Fe-4S binding protein [Pseudomonadales bacterium]MCP5182657.1 4Fe-4S binding protein [Pseudomonadales bacterium]